MASVFTTGNFHLGNILILCTTSLMDLAIEWWLRL
jgi:hypothetical protein